MRTSSHFLGELGHDYADATHRCRVAVRGDVDLSLTEAGVRHDAEISAIAPSVSRWRRPRTWTRPPLTPKVDSRASRLGYGDRVITLILAGEPGPSGANRRLASIIC